MRRLISVWRFATACVELVMLVVVVVVGELFGGTKPRIREFYRRARRKKGAYDDGLKEAGVDTESLVRGRI